MKITRHDVVKVLLGFKEEIIITDKPKGLLYPDGSWDRAIDNFFNLVRDKRILGKNEKISEVEINLKKVVIKESK